ncbi:DnaJ domain-containing protein [candidate division TA06 bacterium]|uniref:DnaJ domain-containing protein n=1 Tax=candidate division TA06 bacterium TaxID=2250710 RepID=A0A933I9A7_UNCT6|nr:DnaJ domain-containing protein [candidate division TA06 bacterium]
MRNYYEILGVSRGAETSEISQSYRRLLQEQYQEMGKESDLSLLSQAHKILTNPVKRRDYDSILDLLSGQFTVENPEKPTKAEKAYLDGLKAFDLQNYQEAVQYFARAARLDPKQGHFFSQWGLSIGMFPGRLPEAELYCKKAIELDPDNPVFYFNLGFLYQRHNLSEAAQQSFSKAQEAQQVRQAKHSARDSAAITAEWRGDAGSLLKELDSIEETMTKPDGEQASVIALPQAEEPVPEKTAEEQLPPVPVTAPEQTPVAPEETSDHSGIDDLLSELDSLESSLEKVETYHNSKIPEPEESRLEVVTVQAESILQSQAGEPQTASDETQTPVTGQQEESRLEIVTVQEKLIPQGPTIEDQTSDELQPDIVSLDESPTDLLKELDSIESMVAGIEQAGVEAPPENIQDSPQQPEVSHSSGLPVVSEKDVPGSNVKELEDEALKLLQELDIPLDDQTPEPVPVSQAEPKFEENISEPDSEAIKKEKNGKVGSDGGTDDGGVAEAQGRAGTVAG